MGQDTLVKVPESGVAGSSPRLIDQHLWSHYYYPVIRNGVEQDEKEASECEMADFMYGLVRILKPNNIFEAGCCHGDTTEAICKALQANNFGFLTACDIVGEFVKETRNRCLEHEYVRANFMCTSAERLYHILREADLAFIDHNESGRISAIEVMKPGSIAVVHDTHVFPNLGEKCRLYADRVLFDTPRGFAIIQKQ